MIDVQHDLRRLLATLGAAVRYRPQELQVLAIGDGFSVMLFKSPLDRFVQSVEVINRPCSSCSLPQKVTEVFQAIWLVKKGATLNVVTQDPDKLFRQRPLQKERERIGIYPETSNKRLNTFLMAQSFFFLFRGQVTLAQLHCTDTGVGPVQARYSIPPHLPHWKRLHRSLKTSVTGRKSPSEKSAHLL